MTMVLDLYHRLIAYRRVVAIPLYGALAGAGYAFAYLLRFELTLSEAQLRVLLLTLPVVVAIRMLLAHLFGLSTGQWRFVGTSDVLRLFLTVTAGTLLFFFLREGLPPHVLVPRSVLLMEWVLTAYGTAGVWIAYRVGFERIRQARSENGEGERKRLLIVGAGEAGNLLAREIHRFPTGYELVGFVDDDGRKHGTRVNDTEVLGGTDDLECIARRRKAQEIIIAIPSAKPERLRELVEECEETGIPFKVLPGINEVLAGKVSMNHVRSLQIEDLLGREPVELELPELTRDLEGRSVLITGAAGSIGAELSRQVALHDPDRLVLLDQAETPLFFLERELREAHPELDLSAVIGNVTDEASVEGIFRSFRPHRVFHAAAYKHVPLMEANAAGAVRNNVVGTEVVARAAGRNGTDRFVLVSTDKAVRPANVMGATKRMAELLVLQLQKEYPETDFGAVRFGNVLGSQGSVIPIFREQLDAGEPLTVTHPDVTRYFMTIPEAVQLILQASLLPELRGRVAMLDMGEPVRIVDLAQNFLRLSGVPPLEGKSYLFTGLRPGEKLHEELKASHEDALETSIEKVRLLRTRGDSDWCETVPGIVRRWRKCLREGRVRGVERELEVLFDGLGAAGEGCRCREEDGGSRKARTPADGEDTADPGGSVKPMAPTV